MIEQVGKNAVKLATTSGSKEEVMARIAEAEKAGIDGLFKAPQSPSPAVPVETRAPITQAQPPVDVPPPVTPKQEETKQSHEQKFKEPDGSLNLEKIEKSNEHLQREIETREQKLLKLNRELQKKFTATSQELSAKSKESPEADVVDFTDEGKRKIVEDIGLDPNDPTAIKLVDSVVKISRTIAKRETEPFAKDVISLKSNTRESRELHELDDLVKEGNDWILTEGPSRFEAVFQDRPYLLQSRTPYRDALKFMELTRSSSQPTHARVGAQTPILGASQTVNPPSSSPASTPEQEIESLSAELRKAIANKDYKRADEIQAQQDRVYKGIYQR